jgi:hypothetical protein
MQGKKFPTRAEERLRKRRNPYQVNGSAPRAYPEEAEASFNFEGGWLTCE